MYVLCRAQKAMISSRPKAVRRVLVKVAPASLECLRLVSLVDDD